MAEQFHIHHFSNGLTLLAQPMEHVSSAAVTLAAPAGAARDPDGCDGSAAVASCWLLRGAGTRDTRQLLHALDRLGCRHSEEAHSAHLVLSAALLGSNLTQALAIYADILRRPHLSEETFCSCRALVAQALDGLEDEPMQKCNVLIRQRFFPFPLGRNPLGTKESLARLQAAGVRRHLRAHLTPRGAILAAAGCIRWEKLLEVVAAALGDWQGAEPADLIGRPQPPGVVHIAKPSAQMQITLAWPAATLDHPLYYPCRLAQMALSGGSSSRLFTEVREKRGLVYAVAAQHHGLKRHAGMFVYAGTTPPRAHQTLQVVLDVIAGLTDGLTEEELARARTQLKSALVMQGESTSARADALAGDFYHLGRVRSLAEISAAVDAVTGRQVVEYVRQFPPRPLTMLTIGPEELDPGLVT